VFESTRRPPLCRIAQMLRDMVEPYIRLEVSITGDIDEAQSDHRAIFEAFRDGNAARVAALSRRHCERTAERLLRALRRRRPSASAGQAIDANRKAAAWGEGEA
jgi:DNA-binding FadR family transcriptional regulator